MHSATSASASAQFFPTSSVSHAQYSNFRSRTSSAARSRNSTRSVIGRRLQLPNASVAAAMAPSACSGPAAWCTPITWEGRAGFLDTIFSAVFKRRPPTTMSYSQPSSRVTCPSAASIALRFSGVVKSTNASFANGWSEAADTGGAEGSVVAISPQFYARNSARTPA